MKEIFLLVEHVSNPLLVVFAALAVYSIHDLKKKIGKVDHIDNLIFQIKSLVEKLDNLIDSQKEFKNETQDEIKDIKKVIRDLSHRVVRLESIQELKKYEEDDR